MPAAFEDPAGPTIHRVSGATPFPDPAAPALPPDIQPRQVTLRDRQTVATVVPFAQRHQLPASLLVYLSDQLNKEIEGGDTYPMTEPFTPDTFASYWFQNFGAVMLLGEVPGAEAIVEGKDWSKECLGSFYIKPNYPGRSSHVCNAGFIVTDASRNRGVGRLMGESYLDWAPRLGYTYSVFNLVYETNVASCRIWDALGFKRIGRVKGCGNLRSHPGRLIDAIIYGRDLVPGESEELVSEERFDKIRFYLKYNKYPNGADRAEKSRLRSAATHYKLLDDDRLMLKDKEVIADPGRQYDIAREVHVQQHGGINKTTATIAEKYHWSRIKETVSDVIRNCVECRDSGKVSSSAVRKAAQQQQQQQSQSQSQSQPQSQSQSQQQSIVSEVPAPSIPRVAINNLIHTSAAVAAASPLPQKAEVVGDTSAGIDATSRVLSLRDHTMMPTLSQESSASSPGGAYANPNDISVISPSQTYQDTNHLHHSPHDHHHHMLQDNSTSHHHHHHHHHHQYQPIDPQMIDQTELYQYHPNDFQALLNATEEDERNEAVERDLEMLIEQGDDDDIGNVETIDGQDVVMSDGLGIGEKDGKAAGYDVGYESTGT